MKAYRSLPDGYSEVLQVNMQKDKKTALKINIGGVIVGVLLFIPGNLFVPILEVFHETGIKDYLLRVAVMMLAYLAYIVLHELTHAAVMKAVGGGQVKFGFTGLYAFAGSEVDYFDKISYRCIALAPLLVWGVIFIVLQLLVPRSWFWVIWFLQIGNVAGAAGDVYITAKLWKMPASILVRDTGVDMTVFDK